MASSWCGDGGGWCWGATDADAARIADARPAPTIVLSAQAVENLFISKMLEPGTNSRTYPVAHHAGVAVGGVAADGRQLAVRAQQEATSWATAYESAIPGHVLSERVASYVHAFNLYWYARPYAATALLATYDDEGGPALYGVDPAGASHVRREGGGGGREEGARAAALPSSHALPPLHASSHLHSATLAPPWAKGGKPPAPRSSAWT